MPLERNLIAPEFTYEPEAELCPTCDGPLDLLFSHSTVCVDCELEYFAEEPKQEPEKWKPLSERFPKQITQRCIIPGEHGEEE